jgi:leader peptidase (prepilin peptidase) / N-methyltransferase
MGTWVTATALALAALIAGSWLITVIAWLPQTDPGLRPLPAHCPACQARLKPTDLIPVLGWHHIRQRCPEANALGPWGLAAPLVLAAMLVIMAARFGPVPALPAYCFLAVVGTPLAFIDASHKRLPDALTLPAYPVALALLGVATLTGAGPSPFEKSLIGLGVAVLLYGLQALIYPAGIGWGDVKLSGLIGLYLGWLGVRTLVSGLFLGYLLAAVVGLILLATRRATRRSQVPFGPFMLAGALIAIAVH